MVISAHEQQAVLLTELTWSMTCSVFSSPTLFALVLLTDGLHLHTSCLVSFAYEGRRENTSDGSSGTVTFRLSAAKQNRILLTMAFLSSSSSIMQYQLAERRYVLDCALRKELPSWSLKQLLHREQGLMVFFAALKQPELQDLFFRCLVCTVVKQKL